MRMCVHEDCHHHDERSTWRGINTRKRPAGHSMLLFVTRRQPIVTMTNRLHVNVAKGQRQHSTTKKSPQHHQPPNCTKPPTRHRTDSHLNLLLQLGSAGPSEGRVSAQQQVGDDTDAPHVARPGEVGAADNLGGHVHLRFRFTNDRHSHISIGSVRFGLAWL